MEKKKLRIAYGRFMQETNVFSPVLTEIDDFKRTHWKEPHEIHQRAGTLGWEVPGYLRRAELSGFREGVAEKGKDKVEALPLLSAWTISGGPLSEACFSEIAERQLDHLEMMWPLDGIYFALHGAMGVVDREDPDGDFLAMVSDWAEKKAKEDGCKKPLIAVTLDLHAVMTPKIQAHADIICAYRTNPHRDHAKRAKKAAGLMIDALTGEKHLNSAWRSLPMVMGGGLTIDFLKPMNKVFKKMKDIEKRKGVLDVSLLMSHPWNDNPNLGWAVHVITEGQQDLAEKVADELADIAWSMREHGLPDALSGDEAVQQVRHYRWRRRLGTVVICDASDVVGAGSSGQNTRLISSFLEKGKDLKVYVPIRDVLALEKLWNEPLGEDYEVVLGQPIPGAKPPISGFESEPISITGRLVKKTEIFGFGRVIRLDVGKLHIAITEGAPFVTKPGFYRKLGLEPLLADACIVKSFFPFWIFFAAENRKSLYVKTKGQTDFSAMEHLEFQHPVFPFDDVKDWRDTDKLRRGLSG